MKEPAVQRVERIVSGKIVFAAPGEELLVSLRKIRVTPWSPAIDRRFDAPRCFDKALVPELKHQQRPKQFAMVRDATLVFILKPRHVIRD